ncbi:TonB-dependent receptor family protein [Brevundimonas sp. SL130]|uniref:TonB-dependent receptor family protein n=1 Tax=Brevundimonas sp. SL130 TaxID=2995143 RepID=UPI00226C8FAE|nr:TonB-dependent receptor [Brevundimonas sp. SL130]WAC59091.1 TonB-dependent receptor [Brevundimonas sp. SL130]
MTSNRFLSGASLLTLALLMVPAAAAAQDAAVAMATADTQVSEVDEIVVFGRGQTRQQASVNAEAIAVEAPGSSPLKAIERLPGVSFQSADAFGSYEWSARITLRSFNQNQLGFTLDGVPLGDMSYGNHNGLHISRAIISENVARVDVAQGSGALGTASSSNLGGTVEFISRMPTQDFGVDVSGAFGSDDTLRGFVRLDTGALGSAGTRLSVSYADQSADKWKGAGEQKQQQINASFVQPIAAGELRGFVNHSERRENDYQDMSLGMIDRLGRDWDNISDNYALAVQVADIYRANPAGDCTTNAYPSPIKCVDDAYYDASGLRDDTIGAVTLDYPVTDNFSISLTGYGHKNEGQGLWWTPYVATPTGAKGQDGSVIASPAPLAVRTTEYDIDRKGAIGSATLDLGAHSIEAGFWVEDNDFNQARRYYGLSRSGDGGRDSLDFLENPFATEWEYSFNTKTTNLYLQDTWAITDALTVNAGFKSLRVENDASTVVGANKTGSIKAEDNFLPQVGASYDLNADHQLFASYAENMRAFESSNTGGPFSASAAGFGALKNTLEPESSRTIEAGWRFRFDGGLQGSVAAYDVEFENRLLTVALGAPILGLGNGIQNVGSVKSRGFEAAALWNFAQDWSAFGSYSYNDSTYEDDVRDGAGVLVAATAGKQVVATPENLFRAELSYDNGAVFGTLAAAYTGERFSSYLNDESADAYTTVELTAGYRFDGTGSWLDGTQIQVNVTNLTDEDYISTVGSGGFQNSAGRQTFLPGAPRQVFASIRRRF